MAASCSQVSSLFRPKKKTCRVAHNNKPAWWTSRCRITSNSESDATTKNLSVIILLCFTYFCVNIFIERGIHVQISYSVKRIRLCLLSSMKIFLPKLHLCICEPHLTGWSLCVQWWEIRLRCTEVLKSWKQWDSDCESSKRGLSLHSVRYGQYKT